MNGRIRTFVFAAGLAGACMLGLLGASDAAPREETQQFANSIEQRMEMIKELREIRALMKEQNELLKEQNELLRSGDVKAAGRGEKR
jgi:hypothetical protein